MSFEFIFGLITGIVLSFAVCSIWYIYFHIFKDKNGKAELQD